ncbi:MAG: cupin domain-containing protein [Candidatus Pseudobacter hemicellulosilyticus]|uniref:Cupin domain-containing protein n=1 Tax=Candidatus Pseudobacter hemicellulosilyticus TaxID=3121375 RepID=A0AAJ5WVR8_9BACT|nr:MAG: cupin domain-containing protein [Pseudobacter sp.]
MQPNLDVMFPGKQFVVFGHFFNFLATGEDSKGQYFIYEDLVPPGGGPPPHTHPDEELFYIIEGEFEFILHDISKPFRVAPGQLVRIPSNAVHTFKNVGDSTGRTITFLLPGDLEQYYRATGIQVTQPDQIPDLSRKPDYANMDLTRAFALAEAHQVRFVLPEPAEGN